MSITSPGVSPKIHTFCQRVAGGGGVGGSEEEASGGSFPGGPQAGRQAGLASDPRQSGLSWKKPSVFERRRRPRATSCELPPAKPR